MAIYNYPTSQTPNDKIHVGTLSYEIHKDVNIKKKLVAVDPISVVGSTVSIHFVEDLNHSEQSALGTLLANHEGEPSTMVNEFGVPRVVVDSVVNIKDQNTLKEKDGRLNVTPTPVGFGWLTWFTGFGDDPAPVTTTGRGEGQQMIAYIEDGYDYAEVSFSFAEPIHVHDGQVYWGDEGTFKPTDTFSIGVDIPATIATESPDGYGNCNKVDTGFGFNIFVPAMGGPGYWDIDLSTDAYISPVTVYGSDPNGYWDLDETTGFARSADEFGKGYYNMFDVPMPRVYFVKNVPMGHPFRLFDIDVYKTEFIHQNWNIVLEVNKKSPGAGWVSGWLLSFRRNNT
jgi:hypothetical protein